MFLNFQQTRLLSYSFIHKRALYFSSSSSFFFHTYKKGSIFLKYQLIRKNTSHKIRILSFDSSKMMTLIVNYRSELRQHLYNLGKRFKNKKMFFLFSLFLPFHHTFPFFLFLFFLFFYPRFTFSTFNKSTLYRNS